MQEELLEYAKEQNSYIEEFWDDSYLLGNESVVLNLNPFFILEYVARPLTRGRPGS